MRGGTLLSEPCKKCGNLQIKYKEDVICMNCQHLEQDKVEQQETIVNDIETKKEFNKDGALQEDKRTPDTFNDIHEILNQIERQVLFTLVELTREQNSTTSSKKYKRYLEIVQTSLKTMEMIKRIKQL
ncbi:MAG: autoantigen p27 domain-containing protein [Candidatus Nitrosocosmicus sp.]|nr:autoantigen p27 domain-containing protein [Candidatus Nitrosocosmicus sp.]